MHKQVHNIDSYKVKNPKCKKVCSGACLARERSYLPLCFMTVVPRVTLASAPPARKQHWVLTECNASMLMMINEDNPR
jgi:hypothetical protein